MQRNDFEKLLDSYYNDQCTFEEKLRIEEWFELISHHKENNWTSFNSEDRDKHLEELFQRIILTNKSIINNTIVPVQSNKGSKVKWLVSASIAAALTIFISISYLFLREEPSPEWYVTSTMPGQKLSLQLADGTQVYMKGGSKLQYPKKFTGDTRTIKLAGEAFFEVAHDKSHPFIVNTSKLAIEVLGTAFNIRAFDDLTYSTVSLTEGRLAVSANSGHHDDRLIIEKNQGITYDHTSNTFTKLGKEDIQSQNEYINGDFNFDRVAIEDVFFTLSQAYGLHFEYDHKQAKKLKISGTFSHDQPADEILRSLASIIGGKFKRNERVVTFQFN